MSNQNKNEQFNSDSSQARKRTAKFLGPIVGAALFAGAMYKAPDTHYDPTKNQAPPSYMESHDGLNPADVVHD